MAPDRPVQRECVRFYTRARGASRSHLGRPPGLQELSRDGRGLGSSPAPCPRGALSRKGSFHTRKLQARCPELACREPACLGGVELRVSLDVSLASP